MPSKKKKTIALKVVRDPVLPAHWGRDHWSTFTYVETVCVDHQAAPGVGQIDRSRMRVDLDRHPLLSHLTRYRLDGMKYPTRLKDGVEIEDHDDYDCLDDLEAAGLLEIISLVNGFVKLTDLGKEVADKLRGHLADGGKMAGFVWTPPGV